MRAPLLANMELGTRVQVAINSTNWREVRKRASGMPGKIWVVHVRKWPEAGVAAPRLGTSAVDVTSDVSVTESGWPPMTRKRHHEGDIRRTSFAAWPRRRRGGFRAAPRVATDEASAG